MPARQPDKPHFMVTWGLAGVSAVVGLLLVPIGVNLLAIPLFSWHWSYDVAQGVGSLIFFLSILGAPLGGLFWICWGAIASSSDDGGNFAVAWLWFLVFLVALTLGFGGFGILV